MLLGLQTHTTMPGLLYSVFININVIKHPLTGLYVQVLLVEIVIILGENKFNVLNL
jgi:hypothetical protein